MRRADEPSNVSYSAHGPHSSRNLLIESASSKLHFCIALIWMVGFFIWFQSFQLPENHIARWMLWEGLLYRLLDLVDPPTAPNAPWSWLFLVQRVPFFLIALGTWVGSGALGSLFLRSFGIESKGAERLCFSVGIGLSAYSLIVLLLGRIGWMSRWPLIVVLLISVLVEMICRSRDTRHPKVMPSLHLVRPNIWGNATIRWILLALLGLFVFGQQLGAMSPQTDFDVLEYHLGGPKEWFQLGQIKRLPHNVYTSFPFLSEMLILSGMVLYGDWDWGALAGQSVIAGFIPLTAIGLYAAGRRWFSENTGLLAALVYLTSPWMYRISIIAYAEGGLSYYLFASLFASLQYGFPAPKTTSADERSGLRWTFLSGLLAGSAMACKYTGLVLVVIPVGLILIWMTCRRITAGRIRQVAIVALIYAVGAACTIGPWLLKNIVETGNPVFPLAVRIFGGADRDEVLDAKWRHGHDSDYANLVVGLMDLPIKLRDIIATNDWHSPLLFSLAPLSLLYCRCRRDEDVAESIWRTNRFIIGVLWFYGGWQFTNWWLLTHHIDRFYVPMFSGVSLLAGIGACWWNSPDDRPQPKPPFWNGVVGAVVIAGILYNVDIIQIVGGFNAGRTDLTAARDTAIAYTVPRQKWVNDAYATGQLPTDFKVLCVGEAALFHAHFPYAYNTVFDHSLFQRICADPNSPTDRLRPAAEILAEFKRLGITHIDVGWSEILRYREPGSYGYTDFVHPDRFEELQRMGVLGSPIPVPVELTTAPLAKASNDRRKVIEEWAPSLITTVAGETRYRTAQLFPVNRGDASTRQTQSRERNP